MSGPEDIGEKIVCDADGNCLGLIGPIGRIRLVGFRISGFGLRTSGLGLRVSGLGLRDGVYVQGLGFRPGWVSRLASVPKSESLRPAVVNRNPKPQTPNFQTVNP